jgi:cation diffusion facilitator CzcD-associated flavoprotein CzcO
MTVEHFDVLVVGAGISGISAGYYLQKLCRTKRYAILEGRADLGGTWDLFRYPGVRSDSDMFTLGFSFRPWTGANSIAEGAEILNYVRDTAREFGIDRHIRFRHRVRSAAWSSADSRWTVEAEVGDDRQPVRYTCNFLFLCSGYYNYEKGHEPTFPGTELFRGRLIHPQHWPDDLDYGGRRVVVIGSGATAVTLVPAMARTAAHVTMLQRSPSYLIAAPARDRVADAIRRILPTRAAYRIIRWRNVLRNIYLYEACRRAPERAKKFLRAHVAALLPPGVDVDVHFNPRYNPWDQRLCLVPDADLFEAMKAGRAGVVTDEIETFTATGLRLKSGRELPADVVVSATGLKLQACGGIRLTVDGSAIDPGRSLMYKGVMLGNVPNCAVSLGYANASWTLRAELACRFVCRVLKEMDRRGSTRCVAPCDPADFPDRPMLTLTSGYVLRAAGQFPRQGGKAPWLLRQNYVLDLRDMHASKTDDGTLSFS